MSISCTVSEIVIDISRKSAISHPLHLYSAPPLGVTPLEFLRNLWRQKIPGLTYGKDLVQPSCDRQLDM